MEETMEGSGSGSGSVARRVVLGRWMVLFMSFLIMSCAGGTYIFGVYSESIKSALGYDQQTITTLGFFKDLGANVGIVSGLLNEVSPSWLVLGVGSLMNMAGYLLIWLAVTARISKPAKWHLYIYMCLGANSQTFANTGSLVTCVKNFPHSRGVVLGILKGYVGLSGAIFTQIYHAVYGSSRSGSGAGILLLLAVLPSAVSLSVMFFIRPTKLVHDRTELRRFYHFLYIALGLAAFLLVCIVLENQSSHFPRFGFRAIVAAIVAFLFVNLAVVARAETEALRAQVQPNGAVQMVDIVVPPKSSSSAPPEEATSRETGAWTWAWLCRALRQPERGEDHTIPQALVNLDMWILFVATTCGVGSTLTAIDNMGQIGRSLGYTQQNITTFVALISIWNFLGRVLAGYFSELLLQRYRLPRPAVMTGVLLVSCVGHALIALGLPGCLYVASIIIGVCFGAQWPIMYAVISELFGLKYYATLYNFGAVSSPLGSYILSVRVAGVLYDREALKQLPSQVGKSHKELTCTGTHCFRLSFIVMTAVTVLAAAISAILVLRTRTFYSGDIYARFRAAASSNDNVHVPDNVAQLSNNDDKRREPQPQPQLQPQLVD